LINISTAKVEGLPIGIWLVILTVVTGATVVDVSLSDGLGDEQLASGHTTIVIKTRKRNNTRDLFDSNTFALVTLTTS